MVEYEVKYYKGSVESPKGPYYDDITSDIDLSRLLELAKMCLSSDAIVAKLRKTSNGEWHNLIKNERLEDKF